MIRFGFSLYGSRCMSRYVYYLEMLKRILIRDRVSTSRVIRTMKNNSINIDHLEHIDNLLQWLLDVMD
jgi:hypothetical protein